ncbi:hypothetical protein GALMADRAFT_1341953 [Galerina marginata CBS 339.88]|uniref:WSC domain-containing protein n=1 Tax=Galerina marginata (strain CBS 339.88) TaxID=685588 RepID=A0A067T0B7_GALM3|nr:hypothetical protein GALMADRAFT_1341953 [Galerina marginata CBS 339.88]
MLYKFPTLLVVSLCHQWASATPLESRDSPTVLPQFQNFAVDGCFTFVLYNINFSSLFPTCLLNRASSLSVQLSNSTDMTVEGCISTCSDAGFIRAGLVAGTQCWCGNVIRSGNHIVANSSCVFSCPGNADEICGGDSSMLEYSIRPPVIPQEVTAVRANWFVIFCAQDDPTLHTLHHRQEASDLMTVERCIDACDAGGFSLAGLEFGRECWCGNADMYGRIGITALTGCTSPCAGNATELCGGPNLLNVYANEFRSVTIGPPHPAPGPIEASGGAWFGPSCVKDEAVLTGGPRTLPHLPSVPIPPEEMTPFLCVDRCAADGRQLAGTEFSQECWCGDGQIPSNVGAPDSDCNMACTDFADFTCGGANRLTVYGRS